MSTMQDSTTKDRCPSVGFDSLPREVILEIIKQLPELVSLDSLIRASPLSSRIFNSYGTEITDAILSSGHIHGHIRVMIRITALIRTSKLPMNNLWDFERKTTLTSLYDWEGASLRKSLSPLHLEPHTPPEILRGIVATHRHITNLSLEFIKIHLERFRALKPRRLVDPSKCPTDLDALKKIPIDQTEEYPVQDPGPPSWAEEQRALRVFWRLQLLFDMKKAAEKGLLLGWSGENVEAIKSMTLTKFYYCWAMNFDAPDALASSRVHPEDDELRSLEVYLCETRHISDLSKVSNLFCTFTPPYPPVEMRREWPMPMPSVSQLQLKPSKKCMPVWLAEAAPACLVHCHDFPRQSWWTVPFQSLSRYGFAFWDPGRMAGFGLVERFSYKSVVFPPASDAPYVSRWLSLLEDASRDP